MCRAGSVQGPQMRFLLVNFKFDFKGLRKTIYLGKPITTEHVNQNTKGVFKCRQKSVNSKSKAPFK
jgi:hypothetical protein